MFCATLNIYLHECYWFREVQRSSTYIGNKNPKYFFGLRKELCLLRVEKWFFREILLQINVILGKWVEGHLIPFTILKQQDPPSMNSNTGHFPLSVVDSNLFIVLWIKPFSCQGRFTALNYSVRMCVNQLQYKYPVGLLKNNAKSQRSERHRGFALN